MRDHVFAVRSAMSAIVELTEKRYAERRGVTPRAISKAIAAGRIPRAAVRYDGRRKMIDVAAADHALGASRFRVDTENEIPGEAPLPAENFSASSSVAAETPGLTEARTDLAKIQTRRAELDLEERLGQVRGIEDITRSMEICAASLARDLDQVPARADDITTAALRGGADAVRALLKTLVREIRGTMANNMKILATDEIAEGGDTEDLVS